MPLKSVRRPSVYPRGCPKMHLVAFYSIPVLKALSNRGKTLLDGSDGALQPTFSALPYARRSTIQSAWEYTGCRRRSLDERPILTVFRHQGIGNRVASADAERRAAGKGLDSCLHVRRPTGPARKLDEQERDSLGTAQATGRPRVPDR